MYRYMYVGYPKSRDVSVKKCDEVNFALVGYYKERAFIYIETKVKDLEFEGVVTGGDFIPFPDSHKFFRMENIFYCDPFTDDSVLVIKNEERKPIMRIMVLDHDLPVSAYIAHHYLLQEDGRCVWNRYFSIYEIGSTLVYVTEEENIPAEVRPSVFEVNVKQPIATTKPLIDDNRKPHPDGTVDWYPILADVFR